MFRLLPLLVLSVGVATAWRLGVHDIISQKRPIITAAQQRRICADLCTSGLGGEPCGEVCFDLMPKGIPVQLLSNDTKRDMKSANTRSDVCPILCMNHLGYPLCQCAPMKKSQTNNKRVDFNVICDNYCEKQNWQLHGCPVCTNAAIRQDGLQSLFKQDGGNIAKINIPSTTFQVASQRQIDWEKWCTTQCANSNGGSACNCDILPFSL